MNAAGTKFWLTVGAEVALVAILFVIIFCTDKFEPGIFGIWLGGFVALATQYIIGNVVASGQVTRTSIEGADQAAVVRAVAEAQPDEGKGQ